MTTLFAIGVVAAAAWWLKRKKGVSGIGRVTKQKRRVFIELSEAQRNGVNFDSTFEDLTGKQKASLKTLANRFGYKQPSRSTKLYEEAYYNNLRRQYQAVAGTNLPYNAYYVYNENGDVIIEYHDYGTDEQKLQRAIDYVRDNYITPTDPERLGYYETLIYIASGGKLIWSDKKQNGVLEECFGGGKQAGERKARISYLASRAKGGITPNMLAHRIWESYGQDLDDKLIKDGVLQAILTCDSVGTARTWIMNDYVKDHQLEYNQYEEVPF